MSLAYSLAASLGATETEEDLTTLVIDHYTRTIRIPKGITTLGVESDDDVLRLNFKMPRYLGTVDLYNFNIRINYINANGDEDVYKVTDKAIVGDNVTFSWLVGPTATAYQGTTRFNVCMVVTDANSVIKQEYNTAIASLPVLEGLETNERVVSEYTDILNQWERRLFGVGDTEEAKLLAFSEEQQENIANRGVEVLATIPEDYQTTAKLANEGVRTKADAIICSVEGTTVAVSDSSDDHVRGLKIFGKTMQVTTTGKNLFKTTFAPGYAETVKGVTFTVNSDKSIRVKGTPTAAIAYNIFENELLPAGSYFISGAPSNASQKFRLQVNRTVNDAEQTGGVDIGEGAKIFVDSSVTALRGYIYVAFDAGAVDGTFYPQMEVGSVATAYEPYTGGKPAPNPDYPQELVSIENPAVNIYGKNLMYITQVSGATSVGCDVTIHDDGGVTIDGTATKEGSIVLNNKLQLPVGEYRVCGERVTVFLRTADNKHLSTHFSGSTVKVDDPTYYLLVCVYANKNQEFDNFKTYPMICAATVSDLNYEQRIEKQALPSSHTLPGIPVTSGGNYTDPDGQQWICDEIDFERGVYVQRLEMNTFTLYKSAYEFAPLGYRYQHHAGNNFTPVNACLCRTMSYNDNVGTDVATTDGVRVNKDAGYIIAQYTDTDGTVDSIDLDILYIRPTPIETPLTADELAAFQALKTNYPNTTVLNDAGAWMNLRYNADTETWINNLIDEKIAAVVAKL